MHPHVVNKASLHVVPWRMGTASEIVRSTIVGTIAIITAVCPWICEAVVIQQEPSLGAHITTWPVVRRRSVPARTGMPCVKSSNLSMVAHTSTHHCENMLILDLPIHETHRINIGHERSRDPGPGRDCVAPHQSWRRCTRVRVGPEEAPLEPLDGLVEDLPGNTPVPPMNRV